MMADRAVVLDTDVVSYLVLGRNPALAASFRT